MRKSMKNHSLSGLNRGQMQASSHNIETSLVVAGAGTGKTRTLIEKVKNLVLTGNIDPGKILILTFSRKAAEELRERLGAVLPEQVPRASTYHSFSWDLILKYRERYLTMKKLDKLPKLISAEEQDELWYKIPCPGDYPTVPRRIVRDLAQADTISDRVRLELERTGLITLVKILQDRYREYKREYNLMDYTDCIIEAAGLLEGDVSVKNEVLRSIDYLLVDEFQDSSEDNIHLLRHIIEQGRTGFFAVGDDWQSIYGFRGARPLYLVYFRRYFPGASIYYLTVNYRSKREIVDISSRFVRRNRKRTNKKLKAGRGKGGSVRLYYVNTFEDEAACIANIIIHHMETTVTVLYRNNWQGYMLKRYLDAKELSADIMTFHSSKGLEFPVVVVAGIHDMIIPNRGGDFEEERRLLYVALSRAKDSLYIVGHQNEQGRTARFIHELGIRGKPFSPPR